MRILMIHNRYKIRGGEDESTDLEFQLLKSNGHHVDLEEDNNNDISTFSSKFAAAGHAFWNESWRKRIMIKISQKKYDIIHVQNHFPNISPSVYYAASRHKIPVVQAVRNYRFICPSANLYRDGTDCRACVGLDLKLPAVRHRCYRNSATGSAVLALSSAFHKTLGTWDTRVSKYIAVSNYVKERIIEGGFPSDRIVVKPNFVNATVNRRLKSREERNHLLYVGRLASEKGLDRLLDSYRASGTRIPLNIVGDGDIPSSLPDGVKLLGRLPPSQVYDLMAQAIGVIMPGSWPEPFGRVAIEAFAVGTPVIASNTGGLAEVVINRRNGFSVNPFDLAELSARIVEIVNETDTWHCLSRTAHEDFTQLYSSEANYRNLMAIYDSCLRGSPDWGR